MSNYFDLVGAGVAKARLNIAGAVGVPIVFTHRTNSPVTLLARLKKDRVELIDEGGVISERRVVVTEIATGQTGFSAPSDDGEPVIPGDTMVYKSRTYHAVDPINNDKFGTTYTVKWVERKRLSSGVG